jgi:hypothetical protein
MTDYVTILHEVKDYAPWRKAFDADQPRRAAAGLTDLNVLREHANPNFIAMAFQAADIGRAKAMAASPELAATMAAAGVIGKPRVRFRFGNYKPVASPTYATMTVDVRNFEAAMKAYATDAADRKAATLTDIAVLQDRDAPNNIVLIWGVGDVVRATAFFDSPALAAHMTKNAGVVGPPERHFWKS